MRGLLRDISWSVMMLAARRRRLSLGFSDRVGFDDAFRPRLTKSEFDRGQPVIAYPDAAYHATWADYRRAAHLSSKGNKE